MLIKRGNIDTNKEQTHFIRDAADRADGASIHHPANQKLWAPAAPVSADSYFTFCGDAGGRVRGGGGVPARRGPPAPGRGSGDGGGGQRIEVRGVRDVTHLVLGLKGKKCYFYVYYFYFSVCAGEYEGIRLSPFVMFSASLLTSSGQLLSTQSCRWRSKPLEHLTREKTAVSQIFSPLKEV